MTMADRISLINKGRLIQLDSPLNIYQHPNQLFVADFIGSPPTNFIDCTPTLKEGTVILEAPGFTIELPKSISDSLGKTIVDKEVVLGIRPEDISLHKKQSSKKQIKGKVYALEPLGSSTIIDVEIDNKLFKTEVPVGFETKINDDIWMNLNHEKIHIFDKKSGKCLQ
jgi:multiple sugar transport system ATP-binding protein